MQIIAAIDLSEGKCVRLAQGQMEKKTIYSDDPSQVAERWCREGADMLHVVDLDGAIAGRPMNLAGLEAIVRKATAPVQAGGGLRELDNIDRVLEAGAARVVLGTRALTDAQFLEQALWRFPEAVVVSLDVRGGRLALKGWTDDREETAVDAAKRLSDAGATRIIVTDIARDGMLTGPNLDTIRQVAEAVEIPVIAAGGITRPADVQAMARLEPLGVEGVIIGKGLYEETLTIAQAREAANAG